ncbi:MAG: carbohydrate porin [Thermodesulfobacteriota bacterium]
MNFTKIVFTLIFLYCFSPLYLYGEETEKKGIVDEVDSTVIDSNTEDSSSNQVQESAQNESPNSISGELQQSDITQRNILLKYGFLERLLKPWVFLTDRLEKKTGLHIGTSYSILYQYSSKTISAQNEDDAASGVLEFFGHWNFLHSEEWKNPGFLGFKIKWAHTLFTDIPPTELDGQIGSLWQTTTTFNKQSLSIDQIWWQQSLFDNKLVFRIGNVDQSDFVDFYMYSSAKRFFLNEAFSQNPTIPFPNTGLLGFIKVKPNDIFYFLFSLGDLNATGDSFDIISFFKDRDYFTTLELNFSPLAKKLGYSGNYHIVFWHNDEIEDEDKPSSQGFNINLSRNFYDKYGAFIRYGYSDGEFTEVKQLLSLGFGITGPFNYSGDFFGVAFAWGEPVVDSLRSQFVLETLYRIQLTPIAQLTPDIQLIFNPTNNPDEDFLTVLGIRLVISL